MLVTLILAILFLVISFMSYANNILAWYELIPFAFMFLAPWLYCRNKKVYNVYLACATMMTGIRFYTNYLMFSAHPDKIVLPITFDQPIIKQFTGLGVVIVLYVWYMYIFYASYSTIKSVVNDVKTYDSLIRNSKITRYINLFSSTTVLMFMYIISMIWIYDLIDCVKYLLIFICTVVVIGISFFALITDTIRVKKEEFVTQLRENNKQLLSMDVIDLDKEIEQEETNSDSESEEITEAGDISED